MANPRPRQGEIQTTLRMDGELHFWLRQYALNNGTTLTKILDEALRAWSTERGYIESSKSDAKVNDGTK